MSKFIKGFLIIIILYHILVTVLQYGIFGGSLPELPAIIRDGIWLLFIIATLAYYRRHITGYLRQRKWPRICFIILIMVSVGISYLKGKHISDILVGIKYGFIYIPIFLSATFIGYVRNNVETLKNGKMERFRIFVKYFLIVTLVVGFIWQIAKFIRPELFLKIGYGPFNDFKFGAKPPIYYLTGYQGTSRQQGIFSGPNNYGYFLIAFLPLIITLCKSKRQGIKKRFADRKAMRNRIIIMLWILAIVLTLSRTAAIGGLVALALVNITWIKQHKKISRGLGILVILGLVGLSVLKGASTLGHIKAKFGSLIYVIQNPSGYGLGTSGPAIHHNGTILPENYYVQLMLDIGTIGFLLRAILIGRIQLTLTHIRQFFARQKDKPLIYTIRTALNIGWAALLIMGLFLHVFEDSMVNYTFFILRGLSSGYLFSYIKK